jgi:hypothetical protein
MQNSLVYDSQLNNFFSPTTGWASFTWEFLSPVFRKKGRDSNAILISAAFQVPLA